MSGQAKAMEEVRGRVRVFAHAALWEGHSREHAQELLDALLADLAPDGELGRRLVPEVLAEGEFAASIDEITWKGKHSVIFKVYDSGHGPAGSRRVAIIGREEP